MRSGVEVPLARLDQVKAHAAGHILKGVPAESPRFGGAVFFLTGEWSLVLPGAIVFAIALAAVPLPRD